MLLFQEKDLDASGLLHVQGERALHIQRVLKLVPGDSIRVGKLNGGIGRASIVSSASGSVSLKPGALAEEAPAPPRELLMVLPRPQSLKKVLQAAATFGIRRLFLIAAARGEKSYFSSPLLHEEGIWGELLLGLEQGVSTRPPFVQILPQIKPQKSVQFKNWLDTLFPENEYVRAMADLPGATERVSTLSSLQSGQEKNERNIVFAIGPEGGWTEQERNILIEERFLPFALTRRVLRVEAAVVAILAQDDLLRMDATLATEGN